MAVVLDDVTTTSDAPPEFRSLEREECNVDRDMSYPAHLAELQKRIYPDLAPLKSDLTTDKLFEQVQAAALEMPGWVIASLEAPRFSLEAISTSVVLRFKEDIVVQVRTDADGGSSVHMRSKSRSGHKGQGIKQVRAFLDKLAKKLV
jgi:uncharacterized protein (DUF1499 family)